MKKITVLMIGNSFSVDAARYTHELSLGSDVEIEVGVLYVGGCSLEQHIGFIKDGSSPYEWFVNGESTGKYISLKDALLMKKWDYITLQQVSVFSGLKDTFYPYIKELINYVREYQKESVFVLHKTWPYQTGFENTNFSHYNYDCKTMYKCICDTYDYVSKDLGINVIIRSGDSIEAAIEKYGEHLDRGIRASEFLKHPNIGYEFLKEVDEISREIPFDVSEQVEILTKYDGYLKRQEAQVEQAGKLDRFKIPDDIDYSKIDHISSETKDKLSKIRPKTLAQASRIGGVKPADISILMVLLERHQVAKL